MCQGNGSTFDLFFIALFYLTSNVFKEENVLWVFSKHKAQVHLMNEICCTSETPNISLFIWRCLHIVGSNCVPVFYMYHLSKESYSSGESCEAQTGYSSSTSFHLIDTCCSAHLLSIRFHLPVWQLTLLL